MKDLGLKRLINVAAAGSLVVSVSGCGVSPKTVAKKQCKSEKKCSLAEFNRDYTSLDDCVIEREQYQSDFEEDYGADCASATWDFEICSQREYIKDCDRDHGACEEERKEADKACDF